MVENYMRKFFFLENRFDWIKNNVNSIVVSGAEYYLEV